MSRRTAFGALVVVVMLGMVAAAVPASGAVSGSVATSGSLRIWTDKDRRADIERIATAWGSRRGVTVEVVEKNFGDIRDQLKTVAPATARCPRLDRAARCRRTGSAAVAEEGDAETVPEVRARRLLVRDGRQASVRVARRTRERWPRREHTAGHGAEDVGVAPEAGARVQEEEPRQPRDRRSSGARG